MDIKLIISILNRPWFIEPSAAEHLSEYAATLFRTGSVPYVDRRRSYSGYGGGTELDPVFRVDESATVNPAGVVQVIRINYAIAKYDLCGDPGTQSIQSIIKAANEDAEIRAVILWFDSPGGQVDGTEALADVIKSSAKPIVTYCDYMLCSAAYWLGSSALEIIVHGANSGLNAVIGSIGTMCYWEDRSGKYEKEGIKVHTVFATKSKDKWAKQFKMNSGDDDAYGALIEELNGLNETFLSAVKSNRDGKLKLDKEDVLTGKTYNANEALGFGLIDKIGDFQLAVTRVLQLTKNSVTTVNSNNNMAFPKTKAAAKAEHNFEAMNEGIWLSHEELANIEQSITASETATAAAQQTFTLNTNEISRLTKANTDLIAANAALQSEIGRLNNLPAPDSNTTVEGDEFETNQEQGFAHNAWADSLLNGK